MDAIFKIVDVISWVINAIFWVADAILKFINRISWVAHAIKHCEYNLFSCRCNLLSCKGKTWDFSYYWNKNLHDDLFTI